MKRFIHCLVATGFGAASVQAQFIGEDVDLSTASGRIEIVESDDGFSRQLLVGGQRFFTDGAYPIVSIEAQRGALYLIGLSSGGTACAAVYVWLHTEGHRPRVTEEFGNRSDLAKVTSDAETVTVTLPSNNPGEGLAAYVYDGNLIREVVMGQVATGIGFEAENWVGRYPFEVFRDADWRARLIGLMGKDAYVRAGEVISTSSPFEVVGDRVTGSGFNNGLGDAVGAIALHRDGRVVVAIRT